MKQTINVNKEWKFTQPGRTEIILDLPHTWNNVDGQDGGNDYYRGSCIYRKTIRLDSFRTGQSVWLEINGASLCADVYAGDKLLLRHEGGYSTFRVNLTDSVVNDSIDLKIVVDNSHNENIYPQKADFTFYGGIYRDVNLIITDNAYFRLDNCGAPPMKITPVIDGTNADVKIETEIIGSADFVEFSIDGVCSQEVKPENGRAVSTMTIKNARLWHGRKDPHLYEVHAKLINKGAVIDEASAHFGCREFGFDPEKGFMLNGESYPLRGVSRHQDRLGVGNALTRAMHDEDMKIIAHMGANTIRLAHYQHDQYFYDLCDKYGMVVWAEIPYITEHKPSANDNSITQLRELISQNYNHPSIVCWGMSNEISVSGMSEDLLNNHKELYKLVHELDHTRPAALANAFMLEIDSPLLDLADIISYNLYFGWYLGSLEDNDEFFDTFHKKYPDKIIGLSEYGADANINLQSVEPQQGDYSEQYQTVYHEHMLKMIEARPYLWATHVWNMFDFAADGRDEGGAHGLNQKGLVSFDRKTFKDSHYLHRAYWSNEPFVHICGRRYIDRHETKTTVKVYTNQQSVDLYCDSVLIGRSSKSRIHTFEVEISGEHKIEACAGVQCDSINIRKVDTENNSYTLQRAVVKNWFDKPGMEIVAGKYSIKDKMSDIKKSPAGAAIVERIISAARAKRGDVAQNVKMSSAMQKVMDEMSLEQLLRQAGDAVADDMIIGLNKSLNQIDKV